MSLSRGYGYFRCSQCGEKWESAYVYRHKGTKKVAYRQECKKCKVACMPYKVENLTCNTCGLEKCVCTGTRHTDPQKAHRSDLCGKCKAGLPCLEGGRS